MTLRITASPPAIKVTDEDGHLVLDTDVSLFHVTDILQGSVTLGAHSSPANSSTDHTLGACHADSDFVRGAMRGLWSTSGADSIFVPSNGLWVNIGGSFVQIATGDGLRFWSIIASGGNVILRDVARTHVVKNAVGQVLSDLPSISLDYFLYVGRFSP